MSLHVLRGLTGNSSSLPDDNLLREVRSGVASPTLQKVLVNKVQDSRQEFNEHDIPDAIDELREFQRKVQQQAGSGIPSDEAARFISLANAVIVRLQAGQ